MNTSLYEERDLQLSGHLDTVFSLWVRKWFFLILSSHKPKVVGAEWAVPRGELRTLIKHGFGGNSSADFNRDICEFILAKSLENSVHCWTCYFPTVQERGPELCTYFEIHSADWIIFKVHFLFKVSPLIAASGPDGRSQWNWPKCGVTEYFAPKLEVSLYTLLMRKLWFI